MEALPNMLMIAPQFRTSTMSYDNIPYSEWRLQMKEFILMNFQTDPHEYDAPMDELVQLKYEANIPSATVEQMCKLKRYYGQLCMMQKRFPMSAGGALETPFTWNDGLVDMRSANSEVTISDIEFEKASVMFNIGACHAQYAIEQPRDSQDSIKSAFMHFQYAAYAFEQLNTFRNSEIFYPSVDLDANVILFFYKVLIAQAQECLVQKSLLDNRSPIVVSRLALWVQETFDAAARIVDEWTVNVPESLQRYYERLCRVKSDMYGVIAYMSLGDHAEKEERKMGFRLQYYNLAAKYMTNVNNEKRLRDRYPELFVTANFLNDVICAKQKNAEKENNFIYHDRTPSVDEAITAAMKDGGPMCKVRTLSFDPLDASVCGADLFASLLPPTVIDAANRYETQKSELYASIRAQVQIFDEQLDQALQKADFDRLRWMLNEGKNAEAMFEIPEELMKRNADMTAYPDCIPNLLEKLRESSDTARVAEAKLNTLIAKLRAIDLPRLRADQGYTLISKELDKLAEHLALAKSNNVSLNKAIAQHSGTLQILSLPCMEMWQKIVPERKEHEERGGMSQEEMQIRKMIEKIVEMRSQRVKLVEQLATDLKNDDLSKKLMGTNEQGAEEVRNAEIAKHSKTQQLIRLNTEAQAPILRAFADANADFFEERMAMQTAKEQYDRKVVELGNSYDVYRDVAEKCEEGDVFYRQLMARCDQFAVPIHAMEEQYREEMEKKEQAQKEAELRMQQIRMSREAQNAMMDFGGPGPHGGPPGAPQGPLGPQFRQQPPNTSSSQRAPRLGDYLETYRARKQNPNLQNPLQIQNPADQMPDELGGPPSPTPSSVCDFPAARGGSRIPMTSPRFAPGAPGAQMAQGPPGAPYQPGYQPRYQPAPAPAPPTSYQSYQPPPQGAYQPHQTSYQTYQHPPQGAPISAPPPPQQQHHQHVPAAHQNPMSLQNPQGLQNPQRHQNPMQLQDSGYQNQNPQFQQQHQNPQGLQNPQALQNPGPQGYGVAPLAPQAQVAPQAPFSAPGHFQPGNHRNQGFGVESGASGAPGNGFGAQGAGFQAPPSHQMTSGAPGQNSGAFGAPPAQQPSSGAPGAGYQAPPAQQAPPQGFGANSGTPGAQGSGFGAPGAQGHQNSGFGAPPVHQPPSGQNSGAFGAPGTPSSGFGAPTYPPAQFPAPSQASSVNSVNSSARQTPVQPPVQPQLQNQNPQQLLQNPQQQSLQKPPGFGPSSHQNPQQIQNQNPQQPLQNPAHQNPHQQTQIPPGFGPSSHQNPQQPQQPLQNPQQQIQKPPGFGAPSQQPQQQFQNQNPQQSQQPLQNSAHQNPQPQGLQNPPAPQQRFQPTPGAPSPWHATPNELKTPWNAVPQYHAPTPPISSAPAPAPAQNAPNPAVPTHPTRSNVDLLSDLLGDFNLPPSIQPSVQNSAQAPPPALQPAHLQPQQPDFRSAPIQLDPGNRPVGAVPPMPQQPQNGAQNGLQVGYGAPGAAASGAHITVETPILVKGASPVPFPPAGQMNMSVSDLSDPNKFEMGVGNAQKLEKRMLHHSIRTNVAPPPLNPADPLNQIDAFSFAMQNSQRK